MTAADYRGQEPAEAPAPAITPAWGAMWAWACGQRLDWDGPAVKAAMRDADQRGVPYRLMWETLARLAWDLDAGTRAVLAEIGDFARPGGIPVYPPRNPGYLAVKAALTAKARTTGGQPVLAGDSSEPEGT